jgi:hypothetical protein
METSTVLYSTTVLYWTVPWPRAGLELGKGIRTETGTDGDGDGDGDGQR